jgi:hypothetical protein
MVQDGIVLITIFQACRCVALAAQEPVAIPAMAGQIAMDMPTTQGMSVG